MDKEGEGKWLCGTVAGRVGGKTSTEKRKRMTRWIEEGFERKEDLRKRKET